MTTTEAEIPTVAGGLRIGGATLPAAANFVVEDPATERTLSEVADGGAGDATAAVDAAAAALPKWSAMSPRERSDVLRRGYELMTARSRDLAALIAAENGKALADATGEVAYAADFLRWYAEEAVRTDGAFGTAPAGGVRSIVTARPVGISALVTPWNFPAAMITRKVGPALAAGCSTVVKPAAETPLTALALADLLTEAGAPAGTVNVVTTTRPQEVVSTWIDDLRVRKLSFTGSTAVGRHLMGQAATRVLRTSMELGGNAPFVVADDADLDAAVVGAMIAKFRNGGQACTAANRFYVHERVHDEFVARFAAAMAELKTGPSSTGADIGPLISARARDELQRKVAAVIAAGATVAYEGPIPETGWFHPVTMLTDVPRNSELVCGEVFGPVAPVIPYSDDDDLLALLNDSDVGLAAYIYSGDLRWVLQTAEALEVGMVGCNRGVVSDPSAPFGGVKQSGIGREGARDGIREYQDLQYFSVSW